MISFGMSAAFATGILLSKVRVPVSAAYLMVILMPIVLASLAVPKLFSLGETTKVGFYPIGLLLGLMWLQAGPLIASASGRPRSVAILIYGYGVFIALCSALAIIGAIF